MLNFVNIGSDNSVIVKDMDFGNEYTCPQIPVPLLTQYLSWCKFLNVLDLQNQEKILSVS